MNGKIVKEASTYQHKMLIKTVAKESGFEKHIYIRDTLVQNGVLNMDISNLEPKVKYDKETLNRFFSLGFISQTDTECLIEDLVTIDKQGDLDEARQTEINLAISRLITHKDTFDFCFIKAFPALFKSINSKESFAITKALMDRIYHLPALLENAVAKNLSGEEWVIESNIDNSGTGPIGLAHHFRAKDCEDASRYLQDFRLWIRGEAMKTLCAYWKTACEKGRFQFSVALIDVMAFDADEKRQASFSVKERQKFWAATRKLENTKLTLELPLRYTNKKKQQRLIIEHRLIDVGARTQDADQDTYPNDIMAKVLDPNHFQKLSQIGTAIHNNTLKLHPKDVFLAIALQTRKAQRENHLIMKYDEDFLLERANQAKTMKSNKPKARAALGRKMDKLTEKGVIAGYIKEGKTYLIRGISQKKSI